MKRYCFKLAFKDESAEGFLKMLPVAPNTANLEFFENHFAFRNFCQMSDEWLFSIV